MIDKGAREVIWKLDNRIKELAHDVRRLEKHFSRRSAFADRCHICGNPTRPGNHYCHEHEWVAGNQ